MMRVKIEINEERIEDKIIEKKNRRHKLYLKR